MHLSRFWKLFFIELIAVISVGAYYVIDSHDLYRWWIGATDFVTAPASCDLHRSACELTLKDGTSITFEISPKPIPLMQPLRFRVYAPQRDEKSLTLTIFATNMNMGFHRFTLIQREKGLYEAQGMLPTCVVGNMIWQANVVIDTLSQSIGGSFYFQTDK